MEMNRFMTFIVCMVVGTVLIMGVLIPIISDSGNNGGGDGITEDILYYMAPETGTHTITLEESEIEFTDPDHDDDDYSTAYGTITIKVDDVVVKEIEWRHGETVADDLFVGTIPLAFGEGEIDYNGTTVHITCGYFLSVQYTPDGAWTDNTYTDVKEYYVANYNYNTYIVMTMGTQTYTTAMNEGVHGASITVADGVESESNIPISLMLSADNTGDYGYAKTSISSIEDNVWVGGLHQNKIFVTPADWTAYDVMFWYYGTPSNISSMMYDNGSGSSEEISTFTPTLDSNGYVNAHVVYDDEHVEDFVIDHAIVPVADISTGGNGGSSGTSDSMMSLLMVIPILMIVGMVMLGLNVIFKKE